MGTFTKQEAITNPKYELIQLARAAKVAAARTSQEHSTMKARRYGRSDGLEMAVETLDAAERSADAGGEAVPIRDYEEIEKEYLEQVSGVHGQSVFDGGGR